MSVADEWRGVGAVQRRVSAGGPGRSFLHHLHVSWGEDHQVRKMSKIASFVLLTLENPKILHLLSQITKKVLTLKAKTSRCMIFLLGKQLRRWVDYQNSWRLVFFRSANRYISFVYFTGIRRTRSCQSTSRRSCTVSPPSWDCWPTRRHITYNLTDTLV